MASIQSNSFILVTRQDFHFHIVKWEPQCWERRRATARDERDRFRSTILSTYCTFDLVVSPVQPETRSPKT